MDIWEAGKKLSLKQVSNAIAGPNTFFLSKAAFHLMHVANRYQGMVPVSDSFLANDRKRHGQHELANHTGEVAPCFQLQPGLPIGLNCGSVRFHINIDAFSAFI